MIYTHFIGHVGREGAKVITGTHGQFMSFDMAVQNFDKGEKTTTWVRVRSKLPNHINLSKWITSGRMMLVEGTLNVPTIYTNKKGENKVELSIKADNMSFVSFGKKNEAGDYTQHQEDDTPVSPEQPVIADTSEDPLGLPPDTTDDLPF